jgi:uncharacterized protein YfdQ (DUF2303 family)
MHLTPKTIQPENTMNDQNNTQAAIEAGKQLASKQFTVNKTELMLVPEGFSVQVLPGQDKPRYVGEHIQHETAESFLQYYALNATYNTAIFLKSATNTFTAIFNYHEFKPEGEAETLPNWCDHKSSFELKLTPEWDSWQKNNGRKMSQEDFAEFITNNLEEIIDPPGAQMLEIATSLQAKTKVNFSKAIKLSNGQTSLEYSEEINGTAGPKGDIKIPEEFTIGMRLFKGAEAYQMKARLKYRIETARLIMWYELIRPHKVIEANVETTKAFIKDGMQIGHLFEATR